VAGESHPPGHPDGVIAGNHAQSQLAPAVPIFDLDFFIESLAELKGRRKRKLSNKKTH
jgi:hypothetical protein